MRVSTHECEAMRIMEQLSTVGRILYAIPMLMFGIFHFMKADMMASMVPIPPEKLWVYLTGVALVAAAGAIIAKKQIFLASLLLGVMLMIFVFSIHLPAALGDGDGAQMAMMSMLKDVGLAGGAFYIAAMNRTGGS